MNSWNIEGEPAQSGEFFGRIVLAGATSVLGKMDAEHPVELVLDAPVAAGDGQQPLGRGAFGQEIIRTTGVSARWLHRRRREVMRPTAATLAEP